MMRIQKENRIHKAFSYIEVIIVVGIISLMSTMVLVAVNQSKNNKELKAAADEIKAAIRETQNYALTGKNADSGCSIYSLIMFTNPSSSNHEILYAIGNVFKEELAFTCPGGYFFSQKVLKGFTMSTISGTGASSGFLLPPPFSLTLIKFSAPFADRVGLLTVGNTDITLTKDLNSYHICLSSGGAVTSQKDPCVFN